MAELSVERQKFLKETGAVVAARFAGFSVGTDGVVEGDYGRWTPLEEQAPMDNLFAVMKRLGLDPAEFTFQQYEVTAANPFHEGSVDLKFPAQMAIKSKNYQGLHQVNLVLRNPFVTAVEIQGGIG